MPLVFILKAAFHVLPLYKQAKRVQKVSVD